MMMRIMILLWNVKEAADVAAQSRLLWWMSVVVTRTGNVWDAPSLLLQTLNWRVIDATLVMRTCNVHFSSAKCTL
jgi:hypothetical protein